MHKLVFLPHLAGDAAYYSGLGAGAEISGAGTMLAEYAPKGKRGIISHLWLWELTAEPWAQRQSGPLCSSFSVKRNCWRGDGVYLSGERCRDGLCYLVAYESERSPVFEKVNDSNQPTAKPAPAGSMFQSKSFWLATGLRLVRLVTQV